MTSPTAKARRRPKISPRLPPVSISPAITSAYSAITAWIVVTVVSKSATSWEIETFITAWSRTIRNWAAASTARTGHLLIGSSAEQLGLLSCELLLGQDPLLFQFAQLPELID